MTRKATRDWRLITVAVVLFICLGLVVGKLVIIQGLDAARYEELAREQRNTCIDVTPRRGTIFDREGEILAISEDVTTVYATPYLVKDRKNASMEIAEILGEDAVDIEKKLESDSGFVYLARKIDNRVAERLKKLELEGIGFVKVSKRFYPMGELASQVIGIVDIDNKGQAGMEAYYEEVLGGKTGGVILEKDATGNPIPGSEKRRIESEDGMDIQITIDKDIQKCVEHNLLSAVERHGAKSGTAVVLDCNTGEILAMSSQPGFDPNEREGLDQASMRNRAITDIYEPGSALKVVTAVASLQEKIVDPESIIQVPAELQVADTVFKDAVPRPSREMTFKSVISESSNVGTIQVALKLGSKRLSRYLRKLGVANVTGVDFPGEVSGILPKVSEWSGTSVATISIGQGISITPLQMASLLGVIANGGSKVKPHFLMAKASDTGMESANAEGTGRRILSAKACSTLTGILEAVVAPGGTGTRAAINYYRVAGKTGTAAKARMDGPGYREAYMATFVGFAPAENPKLVAAVLLDEPTPIWGGETSAPVFKEIMEFSLQHMDVPPSWAEGK